MPVSPIFAFFGMPGHIELLIIGAIILLLFGHRLPSIMRSLGGGIVQFKRGLAGDVEDEDEEDDDDEEEEERPRKKAKAKA